MSPMLTETVNKGSCLHKIDAAGHNRCADVTDVQNGDQSVEKIYSTPTKQPHRGLIRSHLKKNVSSLIIVFCTFPISVITFY